MRKKISWFVGALLLLLTGIVIGGCEKQQAPPPVGKVEITSTPSGAEIFLRGRRVGTTPDRLSGPPGRYRVRLEKPGCQPRWLVFELRRGEVRKEEVTLPEQGACVLLTSRPTGAEIVRDGKVQGSTPLVLSGLMPGDYSVQVRRPGFAERAVSWHVGDVRPQQVMVTLDSNIGQLIVESKPSQALLKIDGRDCGYTPYKADIEAGIHRVQLEKAGFLAVDARVTVERDRETRKTFDLAMQPGSLAIRSTPAGATVRLDGKAVGVTPLVVPDLAAGEHQVEVSKDGFDTASRNVEVAAGSRAEVEMLLDSSTGGIDLSVFPAGVTVYVNDREYGRVKEAENTARTELIRLRNLPPGSYRIAAAHKRADPERVTVTVPVVKGQVARPRPIELWVPNVEVKWRSSGLVEIGMVYAETEDTVTFGAARGVKIPYNRSEFEYIKPLEIQE